MPKLLASNHAIMLCSRLNALAADVGTTLDLHSPNDPDLARVQKTMHSAVALLKEWARRRAEDEERTAEDERAERERKAEEARDERARKADDAREERARKAEETRKARRAERELAKEIAAAQDRINRLPIEAQDRAMAKHRAKYGLD